MAFKHMIVPAMAMAGALAATSTNTCSTSATLTISSQADVATLSACSTYSGSVAIATDVTAAITLTGVEEITGDLVADNVIGLPSLEADSLTTIGGTFSLTNMTLLTSLTFPELTSVATIDWITLPRLSALSFSAGVTTATSVNIYDSELSSLSGLTLDTVEELTISNNLQLTEIDLPMKTIATGVAIEFNGDSMAVSFPNLVNAYNMTLRNVSSLSLPLLSTLNESIGFYGCTFETVSMPNLTAIGGSISFVGNSDLTNVTAPILTTITGALALTDNDALQTINGFPELKTIDGAIDITGNFTSVSLPALKLVEGAVNLQSSENITATCDTFEEYYKEGIVEGLVTCKTTSTPSSSTASSSSSSSTATSTATGGGSELYVRSAALTGLVGVIAAMMGML